MTLVLQLTSLKNRMGKLAFVAVSYFAFEPTGESTRLILAVDGNGFITHALLRRFPAVLPVNELKSVNGETD